MGTAVPQKVLDSVYGSKPGDWKQHSNGGGWIYKTAKVEESVYLHPTSIVFGDAWVFCPPYIQGTRHTINLVSLTQIAIGCHVHDFAYWLKHGPAIGRAEAYTKEQVAEYRRHFVYLTAIAKRLQAAQKKAAKAKK